MSPIVINLSTYNDPWLQVTEAGVIAHFDVERMAQQAKAGCPYAKAFYAVHRLNPEALIAIKPLVWETRSAEVDHFTAFTPFHTYSIYKGPNGWGADIGATRAGILQDKEAGKTLKEAQAACQADYERRIKQTLAIG